MDLELLRSLLAVAEHGAITEAASAIGLSQPALSRRIRQLEEALGTELLERSRRGVVLTGMGRLVAEEGRAVIERHERMLRRVRDHLRLAEGVVSVGGGATAVSYLLPGAIADFRMQHPQVLFQLKEAGSREVQDDVLAERLELGIVTLPIHHGELTVTPLRTDRIVLVARRDHELALQQQASTAALKGRSLVGFEADSAIRRLIDGALRDAGVEMNVVMELRSIGAILRMVASTDSMAFVSELGVARQDLSIAEVSVAGLQIERRLALIQKRGRPLSPVAEAFAHTLTLGAPDDCT